VKAATIAAGVNRLAGHYATPTPAMQVMEMVQHIPRALSRILHKGI
jgi:ADP-dependent NAD(P)H-hydrate dehydratase / NAD(P)H-hydrate epimerase